ncbi:MAG: M3 family metallopeptidase, partial [Bacteroidales bacterium]|nr:M3 family metallopeptidase [Bacteroidales bacterium]
SAVMKYCDDREIRKEICLARSTIATSGEYNNLQNVKDIAEYRLKIANVLGYEKYSDYALENRMAKKTETVEAFLKNLADPTLPAAKKEVKAVIDYAKANGFNETKFELWDFSYWSEKYQTEKYAINDNLLKPYLRLEDVIDAVFLLANKLYGLTFEPIDLPVYHEDVKVYDVKDENGAHKALFYADFFPRDSKRSGAWMTEFSGQYIKDGVEHRPVISIVTNFTKPTAEEPSLITHYEFTTFLHEFGHALHGILAEGTYSSLTGTNVARDFVELPSQIMENWAYEPEYLNLFAKHYKSGEPMPAEYIERIQKSKNYNAAYAQLGQLRYGLIDMAWYTYTQIPEDDAFTIEKNAIEKYQVLPSYPNTGISPSFGHIFSGGYAAGYYSYKWAEVLEADAFALFAEKGIFNTEVSHRFRDEILSRGSIEDADVIYRKFRGHDPQPEALLKKIGIIK